jgi:hypothetical protein
VDQLSLRQFKRWNQQIKIHRFHQRPHYFTGRGLFAALKEITAIDPENVQFCYAEWFWKRQVNSYALQVKPDRFKHQDTAIIDFKEALHIEKIRNEFFIRLYKLLENKEGR